MVRATQTIPDVFKDLRMSAEEAARVMRWFANLTTASAPTTDCPPCPYCAEREMRATAKLLGIWLPPLEGA